MKGFFVFIFCFLLRLSLLQGASSSIEAMKNLEIKVQLNQETLNNLMVQLNPYYSETLIQIDTYFMTKEGRLKLREEEGKDAYLIRYQRPDLEEAKESNYLFYPVNNVSLFLSVLGDSLKEELKVKKQRALYFPKPHIRVHLDQVNDLGDFLEIEIILSKDISLSVAEIEMQELQEWLQLVNLPKINCGYRELLQKNKIEQFSGTRDFNYYKMQNKVFWVIADDLPACGFKRYDVIPCLFVEQFDNGRYGIIQLDLSIANDCYQYTAWRKLIGQAHGFKADVLLIDISHDKLYTLKGKEVSFDSLSRSSHFIDRSYLAPFAIKQ